MKYFQQESFPIFFSLEPGKTKAKIFHTYTYIRHSTIELAEKKEP